MTKRPSGIGGLLVASVQVVASASIAQAETDFAIYKKRCGQCHGTDVKELAHSTLLRRGKRIVTRDRAIELRKFLNRHGRSSTVEADRIYSLLRRYIAYEGQ